MYYDDLPIWGFIGKVERPPEGEHKYYIFTHVHFDLSYNKDKVVEINIATDKSLVVRAIAPFFRGCRAWLFIGVWVQNTPCLGSAQRKCCFAGGVGTRVVGGFNRGLKVFEWQSDYRCLSRF